MTERKAPFQPGLFDSTPTVEAKPNLEPKHDLEPEQVDMEYYESFSWAVPLAFSAPLALCRFEEGDTLYNTRKAYLTPWSEALKHVKFGIQVTFPHRAVQQKMTKNDDSAFESNWRYPLELDILEFENNQFKQKTHVKATQGKLYTFLWKGDFEIFQTAEHPPMPLNAKSLKSTLEQSSHKFIEKIRDNHDFTEAFVMPYDKSSALLNDKLITILENLGAVTKSKTVLYEEPAASTNLNQEFGPTLQLACLLINSDQKSLLLETIKKSVYRPAKNRKSETDQFRIQTHGIYIK